VPSPEVSLLGLYVTDPSSGPPGGPILAAYLHEVVEFGQSVLYRRGPAQVGFGNARELSSFPKVPHRFILWLTKFRATAAHAPLQGYSVVVAFLPRVALLTSLHPGLRYATPLGLTAPAHQDVRLYPGKASLLASN